MSEYSHNPLISADTANHGNHHNGLTTRQDRALMALLESPSIAAVARKAEVGESTLRQWLREDGLRPRTTLRLPRLVPLRAAKPKPNGAACYALPGGVVTMAAFARGLACRLMPISLVIGAATT